MALMLTAAGAAGDRVTGLSLGADDYLAKPFHFPELVLRIQALARRRPNARPRILKEAGLELDPLRRTVLRDMRQLDLSVKEFAVLEALMAAAPGTLSAEQLLEQAWDENADPFTKNRAGRRVPAAAQARAARCHRDNPRRRVPHPRPGFTDRRAPVRAWATVKVRSARVSLEY